MHPKIAVLNKVVIKTQKPLVLQKDVKMIVNVASSITSVGKSVWDVLQMLLGVSVDNSNAISIQGKNGVLIYIDGKPTYVPADPFSAMFKKWMLTISNLLKSTSYNSRNVFYITLFIGGRWPQSTNIG